MQMRLNSLKAAATLAILDTVTECNPNTFGEQQHAPHACLTGDSVILATANNAESNCPALIELLTGLAPFFGYTVTGSFVAAIILQPHERASG